MVHHYELCYADRNNGWYYIGCDENGYQVTDAVYAFHKRKLINELKRHSDNAEIHVFNIYGELQRIISPRLS